MRLGFAVKILGRPQLKSHDSRRWQNSPHLSVSLAYLRDILLYLDEVDIRLYRMHADLAPYATRPDLGAFHHQVAECAAELAYVGELAREKDIRLTFHTNPYTVLNSADENVAKRSGEQLVLLASILDGMGLDAQAVIITHVGGLHGTKEESLERFIRRYEQLPAQARQRLALEHDENRYTLLDTHFVHQQTGIRLVFDRLHFLLNNPERLPVREALLMALSTWPEGVTPKVHFSSPRTEMRSVPGLDSETEDEGTSEPLPWRYHSDFINPFEFIAFMDQARGLRDFDVMLEAKAKDLAVIRLRKDLDRFAPELGARLMRRPHSAPF